MYKFEDASNLARYPFPIKAVKRWPGDIVTAMAWFVVHDTIMPLDMDACLVPVFQTDGSVL